jgi:hypothetical protein
VIPWWDREEYNPGISVFKGRKYDTLEQDIPKEVIISNFTKIKCVSSVYMKLHNESQYHVHSFNSLEGSWSF